MLIIRAALAFKLFGGHSVGQDVEGSMCQCANGVRRAVNRDWVKEACRGAGPGLPMRACNIIPGGEDMRGEDKRGEDKRGEDKRGEDKRGEDKRGEDKRGEDKRGEDKRGEP